MTVGHLFGGTGAVDLATAYQASSSQSAEAALQLVRERLCGDTSLREDQQLVLADLYSNSLLFGWQTLEQAEKAGAYALIIKDTHDAATASVLTVEAAFEYFKNLLLQHCVHRPPRSIALYSLTDAKLITEHAISTYFRHYKLYQYAFTMKYFLDLSLAGRAWEVAPKPRSLSGPDCFTEAEWTAILEEREQKAKEERERAEAEAAAAADAARQEALLAEYEASVPEDISKLIAAVVEKRVAEVSQHMEAALKEQEAQLLATLRKKQEGKGGAHPA